MGSATNGECGASGGWTPPFAPGAVDDLIRRHAERLLTLALIAEADDYVERHGGLRDHAGRALVVRNGLAAPRHVATDAGTLVVRAPRVLDRRLGARFESAILPTYARSTARLAVALPELALRGLIEEPSGTAVGDRALRLMIGPAAAGLPRGIGRQLGIAWAAECAQWRQRSLAALRIGELWIGVLPGWPGLLVLVGATADGSPEILAITDAPGDDVAWWIALFEDLRRRRAESGGGGASRGTGTGRAARGSAPAGAEEAMGELPQPARIALPPARAARAKLPPGRVVAMGQSGVRTPAGGVARTADRCTPWGPMAGQAHHRPVGRCARRDRLVGAARTVASSACQAPPVAR